MNNNELIQLIDNVTLAAMRWDLAKNNLKKAEDEYDELIKIFNEEIPKVDPSKLELDEDLSYKLTFANKMFEVFNKEIN